MEARERNKNRWNEEACSFLKYLNKFELLFLEIIFFPYDSHVSRK